MNIKTLSFGCRLNALECEKITKMLSGTVKTAILVNTCAVTGEAERQSAQTVRKLSRENPNVIIFVTGCGVTRNPKLFEKIPHVVIINNKDKMQIQKYIDAINNMKFNICNPIIENFKSNEGKLSKKFIQVQNGCNHDCTYCVTRLLRGKSVSFEYDEILQAAKDAIENGFYEIVLTGVDTASFIQMQDGKPFLLADLCEKLLIDVPEIKHLRLSSIDPASPEVAKIIDLMKREPRFMPHLHLSMQSGSDTILKSMHRRHNAEMLRNLVKLADNKISFSADIICGFPGETDELFNDTCDMVREMGLIHVHAFPFSARPDTVAATLPNQINRSISKRRVKIITDIADANRTEFMQKQIGKTVSVLIEENNTGRTPDDIDVKVQGAKIPNKTILGVKLIDVEDGVFIGNRI